ncbi:MAG: 3-deoxy-D-manno-octulosonic acid transferase [Flavobacteriales bacterium]|nr:3-deoxy-D-manno-octulosonic acid transferase [Flavobacteriales bacterium]
MRLLYNIGIRSYGLGVLTAGLLGSSKAIKWVEGRKHWDVELKLQDLSDCIWIHASSLGEFEMAKPLVEKIKADPKLCKKKILITFFSPSGYEVSLHYKMADLVTYLPLDTKRNAKNFLDIVKPSMAIFVKYDFWFNFLSELQKRKIPTIYFSSNFREGQFYFKKSAIWQKNIMQKIDHIFCINESSEKVLIENGFKNKSVCGDTRFDKVIQNVERAIPIPLIEKFCADSNVLILGSSWPIEEEILAKYLEKNVKDDLKIIIAPHDISEQHLHEIESKFERGLVRYSKLNGDNAKTSKIVLIDNIGMLSNLYQYGDIAFVGGGFTNGLHNILEACAMGNVLIYGNNIKKYPEGNQLAEKKGSYAIEPDAFEIVFNGLLQNSNLRKEKQLICRDFVYQHQGATEVVFSKVKELMTTPLETPLNK